MIAVSRAFPGREKPLAISRVFHGFPGWWEPCDMLNLNNAGSDVLIDRVEINPINQATTAGVV